MSMRSLPDFMERSHGRSGVGWRRFSRLVVVRAGTDVHVWGRREESLLYKGERRPSPGLSDTERARPLHCRFPGDRRTARVSSQSAHAQNARAGIPFQRTHLPIYVYMERQSAPFFTEKHVLGTDYRPRQSSRVQTSAH